MMGAKELSRQAAEVSKIYEPTPDDYAAVETVVTQRCEVPPVIVKERNGRSLLSLAHPDPMFGQALIMKAIAAGNVDIYLEILP